MTSRGLLQQGRSGMLHVGADGERRMEDLTIFVESFAPPPDMYVFGATDFASAVVGIGKYLGYRVTVCDARPIFATKRRFPGPTRSSSTGRTAGCRPCRSPRARCCAC